MATRDKARNTPANVLERLQRAYPDAHCELEHRSPFELLVATVLSAQTTDVAVNRITPELFRRWPTAESMAEASPGDVETVIGSIGMYRQKARNVVGLSRLLVEHHGGTVPARLEDLVALPGVGRKTANVVLGVAFGAPEGVVVDTHVQRLAQRLGWSKQTQPEPIESDLMRLFPREQWENLPHTLIFHGRRCCTARAPACAACPISDACPSAFRAEDIGRKTPSAPRSVGKGSRESPNATRGAGPGREKPTTAPDAGPRRTTPVTPRAAAPERRKPSASRSAEARATHPPRTAVPERKPPSASPGAELRATRRSTARPRSGQK